MSVLFVFFADAGTNVRVFPVTKAVPMDDILSGGLWTSTLGESTDTYPRLWTVYGFLLGGPWILPMDLSQGPCP